MKKLMYKIILINITHKTNYFLLNTINIKKQDNYKCIHSPSSSSSLSGFPLLSILSINQASI